MVLLALAVIGLPGESTVLSPMQVLRRLEVGRQDQVRRTVEEEPTVYKNLRGRLKSFAAESEAMQPADAAKGWVQLLDAYFGPAPQTYLAVKADELLNALPKPDAWPMIAADLRSQVPSGSEPKTATLAKRLLADVLSDDFRAQRSDLKALSKVSEKSELTDFIGRVECGLASLSGDPGWILPAFRSYSEGTSGNSIVPMPNFSRLVGKRRAEKEIRELILKGDGSLFIANDPQDRRIVDQLLPKLVTRLSEPPWQLITTPSVALSVMQYAMKKWPDHGGREGDMHGTAKLLYCVGLEEAGRRKAAARFAANLVWDRDYEDWAPVGHDRAMFSIYSSLAWRHADLIYWDDFLKRVTHSGAPKVGLRVLRSAILSRHTEPETKDQLSVAYARALLRNGQVREGVQHLRQTVMQQLTTPLSADGSLRWKEAERQIMPSETLAMIGAALHNSELENTAIRALKRLGPHVNYYIDDPAAFLLEMGRVRDAQEVALRADPEYRSDRANLEFLASIYYHENRPRDLLEFVNKCPAWGVGDVSDVEDDREQRYSPRLSFLVAWALAQTGERQRSYRVLMPGLHVKSVTDAEFELLLQLKGPDSIDILSDLANEDRVSSSSLVWKGIENSRLDRFDDAETALRASIALDPWGMSRPIGGRGRARRALAWVLMRQGRLGEAHKLQQQANALALADSADKLSDLGMAQMADSKYRQSLRKLPSCFVTHYRYAQCLASQGFRRGSAVQWKKAFEDLPAGIGELHHPNELFREVFESEISRRAALNVFSQYHGTVPERAKAHYWLGKLYEQLNRTEDASKEFMRSTKIDPTFVDALDAIAHEPVATQDDHLQVLSACKALTDLGKQVPSAYLEEGVGTSSLDMRDMGELCLAAEQNRMPSYVAPAKTYALAGSLNSAEPPSPFWTGGQTKSGTIVARSSVIQDVFLLMDRISEHSGPIF